MAPAGDVLTIGHSTHEPEGFRSLLAYHRVECVVDVRAFPRSRRMPHFDARALERWLAGGGVGYVHLEELGGRRRPVRDSPNGAWTNEAFRGYADHMGGEQFSRGLARLVEIAGRGRAAVMCAEALWWRCHRRLVADALLVRGWRVLHIAPDGGASPHGLTPFAAVEGAAISYPPRQASLEARGRDLQERPV